MVNCVVSLFFLERKFEELKDIAKEIDEEYSV